MKNLGFGLMRLPLLNPEDPTAIDMEQVCRMVDAFLENGFTYFDTAYMYHNYMSERAAGEALVKRHDRDSFTLASKLPTMMLKEKADMERIFNEQLEKCCVDYFDYYLLHCLDVDNYKIAQELDAFDFVLRKKAEGKVRKIGFSFHDSADLLDEILTAHPETEFVQLQINYLDWEDQTVQSRACLEVCLKHGKPVIVMEPVKGGMLAGVPEKAEQLFRDYAPEASDASWAVRFAASCPGVFMVLSGMSDYSQLQNNMSFMKEFDPMSDEEKAIVFKAVDIIHDSIAIQCTGCRYCVEGCPQGIPIPEYFKLYNNQLQFGDRSRSRWRFGQHSEEGQPSQCIGCGQCESHCPQHLPIIENLKLVSDLFE